MAGLLRYQIFLGYGAAFLAVWYYLLLNHHRYVKSDSLVTLIQWAPFFGLVFFASFALSSLIIGVMNFRDCPDAAAEIEKQVLEAKAELKKRGIIS